MALKSLDQPGRHEAVAGNGCHVLPFDRCPGNGASSGRLYSIGRLQIVEGRPLAKWLIRRPLPACDVQQRRNHVSAGTQGRTLSLIHI
jgi:hypothetical protein